MEIKVPARYIAVEFYILGNGSLGGDQILAQDEFHPPCGWFEADRFIRRNLETLKAEKRKQIFLWYRIEWEDDQDEETEIPLNDFFEGKWAWDEGQLACDVHNGNLLFIEEAARYGIEEGKPDPEDMRIFLLTHEIGDPE